MPGRDLIFISHANPEDNQFARWLTLKLANVGYRTWCDVTRLLGGEDFWGDVERAIRENAIKFLYVLSRPSNHKDGSLRELAVASAVQKQQHLNDFIVPVRIDDLPFGEMNIELARLNAVDFSNEWAVGLKQLLKKLDEDAIPRDTRFGPDAVRQWWANAFNVENGVSPNPDTHVSNWFAVALPEQIYIHTLVGLFEQEPAWAFPTKFRSGLNVANGLVTFAPASDLEAGLGSLRIQSTVAIPTATFLSEGAREERQQNRDIVTRFLSQAWARFASERGLRSYQMANERIASYFDQEVLPDPDVDFTTVDGRKSYRGLMGYKTVGSGKRHWHFAVSAKPAVHPQPLLMMRNHVLFSNDGVNLWSSPTAMHRARRSQCKQWWNDDWRDRLLATMTWLSQGAATIKLPLGTATFASVPIRPLEFVSPVALNENALTLAPEPLDEDEDEDEIADEAPEGAA